MNSAKNGEAAASTSPRSVLVLWEMNGHGELARESSRNDLKFTAMEDDREIKRHTISEEKCVEKEKIRVSSMNYHEFNERRAGKRKNGHCRNAESALEFAAMENYREHKRHKILGEKWMEDGKARVSSLTLYEFDEHGAHRRKKKKKKLEENEMMSNPMVVFGSDIMLMILYRLDARSLAQCILVSRRWQALVASDYLWSKKIKVFPTMGMGKHKYSFQRVEILPLHQLQVCGCKEHNMNSESDESNQFDLDADDDTLYNGSVCDKEINVMNRVMQRLLGNEDQIQMATKQSEKTQPVHVYKHAKREPSKARIDMHVFNDSNDIEGSNYSEAVAKNSDELVMAKNIA